MRYKIDHDLHIHSSLSLCSRDPEHNTASILKYAEDFGLETICLTDHFWDERVEGAWSWYRSQDYAHVCQALPLPRSEKVNFLFGVETELDKDLNLAITRERYDSFDFVVIPTTHLHMESNIKEEDASSPEGRARAWLTRFDGVLNMDIPFYKTGIAHLTCTLIAEAHEDYLKVLELLPKESLERLFSRAASLGVGIELNRASLDCEDDAERELRLRPFRIAKAQGCKFYLGTDAHHPEHFIGAREVYERVIDDLSLTEEHKFHIRSK